MLDMLMVVCDTYNDVVNELIVVIRFTLTLHKNKWRIAKVRTDSNHFLYFGDYNHAVSFSGRNFVNFS
ncbi:hypothetical protein U737_14125 [Methylomonas sp. LW13]|nr:hypothetical protein [Methylomonas sp. ZR1]QBC27939.1 hypothetical protein U737_14125 [Methylomonas sp. LW13]